MGLTGAGAGQKVFLSDGPLTGISIENKAIRQLIEQFEQEFQIEISGLDHLYDDKITFESSGNSRQILERFLKQINETDYVFFYRDGRLSRVVIVDGRQSDDGSGKTKSVSNAVSPETTEETDAEDDDFKTVCVVQDVIQNTTAAKIGLQKGDLIIEYDNVRISHFNELKRQTRIKRNKSEISLLIVREMTPIRMYCEAGTMGVVITMSKIPGEELESYYRE